LSAVTITPDPQDVADLQAAMARFEREFRGGQPKALRKAAAKVLVSMRTRAKEHARPARARDVIENPAHVKARGRGKNRTAASGAKFLIVVKHQDKADTFIPTNKRSDKRRRVAAMGFAASSLTHSMRRLGPGTGERAGRAKHRKAFRFQRVAKKLTGAFQNIRIQNSVSYLTTRYPGIVEQSIAPAARNLVKEMDDLAAKKLASNFK